MNKTAAFLDVLFELLLLYGGLPLGNLGLESIRRRGIGVVGIGIIMVWLLE